jgi:hypothetical protein
MELILNVAWLVLAVVSYVLLFRRLANYDPKDGRIQSRLQHILALTCVLAILFPVISLSDDLLAVQAKVEDASLSRLAIKKFEAKHSSSQRQALHQGYIIVSFLETAVSWIAQRRIAIELDSHVLLYLQLSRFTRAPPSFSPSQIS